jgi:hypothetical protein
MANVGIIIGIIVIAVVIGFAYYISLPPTLPTTSVPTNTITVSTTIVTTAYHNSVPILTKFSSKSVDVNSSSPANVTVTAPDRVNITVMIPSGTYALVSNNLLQTYNFTIATFTIMNVSSPTGYKNQTPAYGFAFEVNGSINPAISFVNANKAPMHLTTVTHYPSTWYSWAYVGGTFNTSTGTYAGGNYLIKNTWTYNTTKGTMTNTQFYKSIMWIFTIGPAQAVTTTTVATTVNASTVATSTLPTTTASGYGYP